MDWSEVRMINYWVS